MKSITYNGMYIDNRHTYGNVDNMLGFVLYQKPSAPDETGAGYGYSNAEGLADDDIYFYHSDHLGSTSYITDRDGNSVQYIAYKPFGETLIDEHAVSYDSPWKFNGKEWDSETGLYYYGARYYEPTLAIWYGVDALAEKYPAMGGYVYCHGNPIRFVDFDGNVDGEPVTATFKVKITLGTQIGFKLFDFVSCDVNIASIELASLTSTDTGDDCHTETEVNYICKNGQVTVGQEISVSGGLPIIGEIKAGYGQEFTTQGYGTTSVIEEPELFIDFDAAKYKFGAAFILGFEVEFNYDWAHDKALTLTFEKIKNSFISFWKGDED